MAKDPQMRHRHCAFWDKPHAGGLPWYGLQTVAVERQKVCSSAHF